MLRLLPLFFGPIVLLCVTESGISTSSLFADERPNILWITCEDTSPDLGCYGDDYAQTPNLDRLASQGMLYRNAFSHAGVCAPSRSGLITCMYPTSIGTQHMRCQGVPPPEVKCFTEYLRAAGYYCTNNSKTDYQFPPPLTAWDENSAKAHWRNRPADAPFFAVFNFTVSHESQIRANEEQFARNTKALTPEQRHDPNKAHLPPYYPDTPVVRRDWARYYDLVTAVDYLTEDLLRQLDEDGLTENTVVFFYGDHGRGLPRAKRWIYDSGIRVPLIIRWPGKIPAGSISDELVSFIDFGATVLSIAGVSVPKHMQGRPFLGEQKAALPRKYVFAARDRMDERYDVIRAVRDERFKYIRNYMPEIPYAQDIGYMNEMPTMREWRRLHAAGELTGPASFFFQPTKPIEELYDTLSDPHEIRNLANDPRYAEELVRLRKVHQRWVEDTGDLGLVPEAILNNQQRPSGKTESAVAPTVEPIGGKITAEQKITLTSSTPGSSIAYWLETTAHKKGEKPHWQLYHEPFRLSRSGKLHWKACRIGFTDSPENQAEFVLIPK